MYLVENKSDIMKNIKVIDNYLSKGSEEEKEFALLLIKRGTCFVALQKDNGYVFYPSRFVGYKDNNMDAHLNNESKDGRETNPALSEMLGSKPVFNRELEGEYRNYCESLGFVANEKGAFGVERKYWLID